MNNLLLHACCGPCTVYPVTLLRNDGFDVTAYAYNPNIHPYREFKKRLTTLKTYAGNISLPILGDSKYGLTEFIRKVAFNEKERCEICYITRLEETARMASENHFDSFTTTLLYSKYQNHSLIKKICDSLAEKYDITFLYHDFREGWQEGIDSSIALDMYRQPYCGCIYSEQERYDKSLRKKKNL